MNVLVTTRKSLGHVFERQKDVKGLGGCLNHNFKEEKLSNIVERNNRTKILIRRDQLTKLEDFENE